MTTKKSQRGETRIPEVCRQKGLAGLPDQTMAGLSWKYAWKTKPSGLHNKLMAELFQTTKQNISLHIQNIYEEGELTRRQLSRNT